jgi:hypothetical protein
VLQRNQRCLRCIAALEGVERAVVEDGAVLVDLHQRRPAVSRGGAEHRGEVPTIGVDGAGDEGGSLHPAPATPGLNGRSTDPDGVDLVTLPTSDVGEYWPLVSP